MHKIASLGHSMCASGRNVSGLFEVLTQRNFVAEFHRNNASFSVLLVKQQISDSDLSRVKTTYINRMDLCN